MPLTFSRRDADVFAPFGSGLSPTALLARTTHLCVAAHQDDVEIMAHHGIAACHGRADRFFTGVVVTNGAGSPRAGPYSSFSDDQMLAVRRAEQRRAAEIGRYNLMLQLGHTSSDVKAARNRDVFRDLTAIFAGCAPEIVYLHQPVDKHDTHVAVLLRCVEALRALPRAKRPRRVLGCEVWRDLDWLLDADKVPLDASGLPELAPELLKVFDSQVAGGKRYDLATLGRRRANATFHTSHATDATEAITWAMDLTPLVEDETKSVAEFALVHIERLRADVAARIARFE
ncbi:MAG TPA: PIG-L family deacetylase [Opitutus sp.]|nr:PIG-L family deacetylase [Opitutus sp.]